MARQRKAILAQENPGRSNRNRYSFWFARPQHTAVPASPHPTHTTSGTAVIMPQDLPKSTRSFRRSGVPAFVVIFNLLTYGALAEFLGEFVAQHSYLAAN